MIEKYLRVPYKNLSRRKLRSWLTMLGIIISICVIFVLASVSIGLQASVEEQFELLGADKIFVQPKGQLAGPGSGGAVTLTENDLEVVERVSGINEATVYVASSTNVEFANQIRFANAVGVDLGRVDLFLENGQRGMSEGRSLRPGDTGDVMIGSQYKFNNFFDRPVEVGDQITVNGKEFTVRGIMKSLGNPPDDRIIYMDLDEFRELYNVTERVDMIIARVDIGEDVNEVAERIDKRLMSERDVDEEDKDYTILTPEELLETVGTVLNILTGFLIGIAAISLLVGGIGIANTMYTAVLERTKEIGVMKAIGARNEDIMFIFTAEAGLLGLAGGSIGVILGIGIGQLIEFITVQMLGVGLLQVSSPWYLILGVLAFSFLIGAISGMIPAWRASKIKPVRALRYE